MFYFTVRVQSSTDFWLKRAGLYLLDGLVDSLKGWVLAIMENSPVTMENEDTFLFSLSTVAAIDTVVWTVVPLAGKHIQAFCNTARQVTEFKWVHWANSIRTIYNKYLFICTIPNQQMSLVKPHLYTTFMLKIIPCMWLHKPGLW